MILIYLVLLRQTLDGVPCLLNHSFTNEFETHGPSPIPPLPTTKQSPLVNHAKQRASHSSSNMEESPFSPPHKLPTESLATSAILLAWEDGLGQVTKDAPWSLSKWLQPTALAHQTECWAHTVSMSTTSMTKMTTDALDKPFSMISKPTLPNESQLENRSSLCLT
jgi:hypothetical protein